MCNHRHFCAIVLVTSITGFAEDRRHELIVFTADNSEGIELFFEHLILGGKDETIAYMSSIKILTDGKEDENLSSQMTTVLRKIIEDYEECRC